MKKLRSKYTVVGRRFIRFRLSSVEFGIPIDCVKEVIRRPEVTGVPAAPGFIDGFICLRDMNVPVLDMRSRFSLDSDTAEAAMIIIASIDGRIVGLAVDGVGGVVAGTKELKLKSGTNAPWDACVDSALETDSGTVFLIDPAALLTETEFALLDAPKGAALPDRR